jgi:iron complex outermembrane receptor protein
VGRKAAVCCTLAALPVTALAQAPGQEVEVTVRAVSEGGAAIAGVSVTVHDVTMVSRGPLLLGRFESEDDAVSVPLAVGRDYRVRVQAPGHRGRDAHVSPSGPVTLHVVLSVDPYELPPIMAAVGASDSEYLARSVTQARFADESLTYATVAEWLRDVPGAAVRGPGGSQALSVRGSRSEDVLVLLDGVPLNDPLTGRADLAMIPTSTLESGTLVRGAASQRYGSGAGAGVLLLTSRIGHGTGLSGGVRMESFGGMGLDLRAETSGRRGRLALSVSASRAENDFSFRNPVEPDAAAEVRTNADAAGVHGALTGASGPLSASLRFDRSERGVPGRAGTRVFADSRAEDQSWIATTGIELPEVRGSASYGWHRLGYRASAEDSESAQEVRELRMAGDTDIPSSPLTLGGRLTREEVEGDAIAGSPGRTTIGGRLAAALTTGRFRVDPALSVDVAGDRMVASPEISAAWLINPQTRAWGRVGQGFRFPTFGDLYFASQYQLRANPDLKAERIAFDSEVGVSFRTLSGGVELETSASAWARRTEDPIVWLASSVALWSPRNLGELQASGLDLQVEVVSRGPAEFGWRAQLAGTLQQSRVGFGSNRNPLPYEPGTTGRASFETWRGAAGLRLDIRYTGPRSTSLSATRSLDGFTTLDLSSRYHLDSGALRIGLFARIENLMDRRYQMIELFPEPGRQFTLRIEARRAAS